jgi:hypothetical protein
MVKMELQMKAICDGRATRSDVVQQSIEQYRAVYNRTREQMSVLKEVRFTATKSLDNGLTFPRLSRNMCWQRLADDESFEYHEMGIGKAVARLSDAQ